MGAKWVRHLAALVVVFECCIASVAVAAPRHQDDVTGTVSGSGTKSGRSTAHVAQLPKVEPKECEKLAQKLTQFKTEEKSVKGTGVMLCSEASCMRLTDKIRKYSSTFVMHADLKEKTIELRHVKEADKELGTPKTTYSFYVHTGEDTEKIIACFGDKPLKGAVVVQSFVKTPMEGDTHLKFRANVLNLEVTPPVAE